MESIKKGAVISHTLFGIYIDDLLLQLSQSGVGCFVGLHFLGALAYADDIVLIMPSLLAMSSRLLAICDAYASEYDIEFNGSKSKLLVIASFTYRSFYRDMCAYSFTISGKSFRTLTHTLIWVISLLRLLLILMIYLVVVIL